MDPRDFARRMGKSWKAFDEATGKLTVTVVFSPCETCSNDTKCGECEGESEVEAHFPAHYEVCDLCDGRGRHVNPSVDAGGISAEEMYDDPDFAEAYFGGAFDVPCYECGGRRVVPVVDDRKNSNWTPELRGLYAAWQRQLEEREDLLAQMESERRMGA